MNYVPKGFDYGVIQSNSFYYASINSRMDNVMQTGFVSVDLTPEQNTIFYKIQGQMNYDNNEVDKVIEIYVQALSTSGTYVCTLDKETVKQLKGMSRAALFATNEIKKTNKKTKEIKQIECKVTFTSNRNNQLTIEIGVDRNHDKTKFGGFGKAKIILDDVDFTETFELTCENVKYLPSSELELRVGDNGLLSFSSSSLETDTHFLLLQPKFLGRKV